MRSKRRYNPGKASFLRTGAVFAAWYLGMFAACAADLPAKALAVQPRVPVCGNGFYFGINTMGAAGAVSGSPIPGESIVQGEIGATIGYTGTVGTCVAGAANPFWFIEGRFDLTNLNGSGQGLTLSGPIHLQQRIGYGTPAISTFLSSIPGLGGFSTPSLPVLPTGVTSTTSVPYLALAVNEQDISAQIPAFFMTTGKVWEVTPEFQIGMWNRLSNSVVIDVHAGYQIATTGVCFGGTSLCPSTGNRWTAGMSINF